jgi:RNA-directed DNA polymerase
MPIDKEKFLALKAKADLAALLGVKYSALNFFAYAGGKRYKTFEIKKKDKSLRAISAPVGPLKSIQRKIATVLNEIYPEPLPSHGFVKDRSIITNADPHVLKRIVLNLDLEDFFPSIHAGRVLGLFQAAPFNFSREIASTLTGLSTFHNQLPQGAPTSPILSNMICFQFDRDMARLAARTHTTYTRYGDDITFSTMAHRMPVALVSTLGEKISVGQELESLILKHGFKVNHSKTRIHGVSRSKYVTGVKVNEKRNVARRYTRQVRAMVHALVKFGPKKASREYGSKYAAGTSKNFVNVLRGKLAHLKNVKSGIDPQYVNLFNGYASVFGLPPIILQLNPNEELEYKTYTVVSRREHSSGFVLNSKYLVTAAHSVAADEKQVEYFDFNNFPMQCRSKAHLRIILPSADVAFFNISGNDLDTKSLQFDPNRSKVVKGKSYRASGYPSMQNGQRPHITPVIVIGKMKNKYGVDHVHVNVPLLSGNSGGPVVDDQNQVVGIVVRGAPNRNDPDYGSAFVPMDEILRLASEKGVVL